MMNLKIEAPWYTHGKMLAAMFKKDPDISVGVVTKAEDKTGCYVLDIEVRKHEKFLALDKVLNKHLVFGNVTLDIYVYDLENALKNDEDIMQVYATLFEGNPIVEQIATAVDPFGVGHGFVCFAPEVVQFYDDNINDLHGNWNGLAEDIAREVFLEDMRKVAVHFCTALNDEDTAPDEPEADTEEAPAEDIQG